MSTVSRINDILEKDDVLGTTFESVRTISSEKEQSDWIIFLSVHNDLIL